MAAISIRDEFKVTKFGLSHPRPDLFLRSQWQCPKLYLLWRIIWPVYHFSWIIASGALNYQWASSESNRIKWFVYLTNWTYFTLTVETITEVIVLMYVKYRQQDILTGGTDIMPWYMKASWAMYNIATTSSIMVSALYWSMIYNVSKGTNPVSIAVHGLNSVYVVLNLFLTAVPVQILHFYQPMLYGIVYIVFTGIYYVAGGTNIKDEPFIYPIMNWGSVEKTLLLVVISTCVVLPIMHVIVYILYYTRAIIYCRISSHKNLRRIEDQMNNGPVPNCYKETHKKPEKTGDPMMPKVPKISSTPREKY